MAIIEQYRWQILTILGVLFSILSFIGREQILKYYREKISPCLHRWYEAIKSKMPKRVPREELEKITKEIEKVKDAIEEVKFKPEISDLTAEEKRKLSVSCLPKFRGYYPPSVEFEFEIDNRFERSFILDRLFYHAIAGANKKGESKIEICNDVYFDKRVVITGGNKTQVSKISMVSPLRMCDRLNEHITKGGKYDIKWEITIEMFFEGDEGLKLLNTVIKPINPHSEWEVWYKTMKEEEKSYWEKGYKMWKEYENEGYIIKP